MLVFVYQNTKCKMPEVNLRLHLSVFSLICCSVSLLSYLCWNFVTWCNHVRWHPITWPKCALWNIGKMLYVVQMVGRQFDRHKIAWGFILRRAMLYCNVLMYEPLMHLYWVQCVLHAKFCWHRVSSELHKPHLPFFQVRWCISCVLCDSVMYP